MKRNLWTIALIVVAVSAFATGGAETTKAAVEGPVEIVTTYWGGAAKIESFERSAAAYMEEHPNVTIKLINIPQEYTAKVIGMFAAGSPPDVININGDLMVEMKDQLLPLSQQLTELGYLDPKDGLWESWFNKLVADGSYSEGEQIISAPLGTGTHVLAYNKEMFDAAGIAYPNETWTWEGEFLKAARALTKDGKFGFHGLQAQWWAFDLPIAKMWGGAVFDVANGKYVGDQPATVAAYQFVQDLIYKYGVHPTPAQAQALGGDSGGLFKAQNAAMYVLASFQFPEMYNAEFAWDVAPVPSGPKGSWAPFYGGQLSIYKNTKSPDHAFAFINLINGPIGQKHFSIDSGFNNPPLKKIAYTPEFLKGPVGAPEHNSLRVTVLEQSTESDYLLPNLGDINRAINAKMGLFWEKEIDAKELLTSVKADVQAALDKGW